MVFDFPRATTFGPNGLAENNLVQVRRNAMGSCSLLIHRFVTGYRKMGCPPLSRQFAGIGFSIHFARSRSSMVNFVVLWPTLF